MLSTIRHFQKGIMIAVAAIIIVAFTFLYNPGDPSRASDKNVFNINGRAFTSNEALRLRTAFNIMLQLGMTDFAIFLYGVDRENADYTDFAVNLALFRDEAKRMGIVPSDQEIKNAARSLPVILRSGLDENTLKRQVLGPAGYTLADFYELVSDYVAFKRIRGLVNSGIEPLDSDIESAYERDYVSIHGSLITIAGAGIEEKAKAEVTDKEIAEHHAANGDLFQSPAKRAVDVVRFERAVLPEEATNEERAKAELDYTSRVDEASGLFVPDGTGFDEAVKKSAAKVDALEPFAAGEPPESIADDAQIQDLIFSQAINEKRPVSDPIKLATGDYIFLRLREEFPPAPLDLEVATPQIREKLVAEKTNSLFEAAVAEARAKITESLEAGKPIAEAAKAAGLEAKPLPPFTPLNPPADLESAGQIAQAAVGLNQGQLSNSAVFTGNDRALVHVDKKELVESPDEANRKSTVRTNLIAAQTNRLMRSWFRNRFDEADIWTHYRLMGPDPAATPSDEEDDDEEGDAG